MISCINFPKILSKISFFRNFRNCNISVNFPRYPVTKQPQEDIMLEELDKAELVAMIRKAAARHGLWGVSSQLNREDRTERVWWFRRLDEKQFIQKGLTDE